MLVSHNTLLQEREEISFNTRPVWQAFLAPDGECDQYTTRLKLGNKMGDTVYQNDCRRVTQLSASAGDKVVHGALKPQHLEAKFYMNYNNGLQLYQGLGYRKGTQNCRSATELHKPLVRPRIYVDYTQSRQHRPTKHKFPYRL
jgi:hypothetical protein